MIFQGRRIWLIGFIFLTFIGNSVSVATKATQSFSIGEHTAELNGLKLCYKISGSGPVCLMPSPPWGLSSSLYNQTLGAMEKVFTVVYVDSRGTGRSEKPKTLQEYSWDHLVGDLEALRIHLKQDKVWLMGHSEAGVTVMKYACTHPNRVSGLVLLDTLATANKEVIDDIVKRMIQVRGSSFESIANTWCQFPSFDPASDNGKELLRNWADAIWPIYWSDMKKAEMFWDSWHAQTISPEAYLGGGASGRGTWDVRDKLKKVTVPTLIVAGGDSLVCGPKTGTILHLCLSNSKLLVIEDCGHFMWLEQPEQFETLVTQFLETLGLEAN